MINKQNQNKILNSFIPGGETGEWKSRRNRSTMSNCLSWVVGSQVLVLSYASLVIYTVPHSCLCIKYFIEERENK